MHSTCMCSSCTTLYFINKIHKRVTDCMSMCGSTSLVFFSRCTPVCMCACIGDMLECERKYAERNVHIKSHIMCDKCMNKNVFSGMMNKRCKTSDVYSLAHISVTYLQTLRSTRSMWSTKCWIFCSYLYYAQGSLGMYCYADWTVFFHGWIVWAVRFLIIKWALI